MQSQCTNDGAYNLTVTFKSSADSQMNSDMAQVLVQNRVSLALPVIPAIVQNEGITVKKMSPSTLMIVNLVSPHGTKDNIFLSNYATINVKDELGRLPGIAGITYMGQRDYSLRAWLDPDKLARAGLCGHGRGRRHRPAEQSGGGGADRPAPDDPGPAVSAHDQHPGPIDRSGAIREHHHQGGQGDRAARPLPPPAARPHPFGVLQLLERRSGHRHRPSARRACAPTAITSASASIPPRSRPRSSRSPRCSRPSNPTRSRPRRSRSPPTARQSMAKT